MPELEPLRELARKWRGRINHDPESQFHLALGTCADELESLLPQIEKDIAEHGRLALAQERRELHDWIDAYAKSEDITITFDTPSTEQRIQVLCTLLSSKAEVSERLAVAMALQNIADNHHEVWIEEDSTLPDLATGRSACSCGQVKADGVTRWAILWRNHILALIPPAKRSALDRHDAEVINKFQSRSEFQFNYWLNQGYAPLDAIHMAMDDAFRALKSGGSI